MDRTLIKCFSLKVFGSQLELQANIVLQCLCLSEKYEQISFSERLSLMIELQVW